MKEFGSDFHFVSPTIGAKNTLFDFYPRANLYADGRQALIHLYKTQGWERLWMPQYFCYDVVESLRQAGLELMFYTDWPEYHGDSKTLEAIQKKGLFRATDAVLRVNYYGSRAYRQTEKLTVAAIVEDHTHDLIGDWAMNSYADWCIASLRKSLPLPEGGILWSPVGLSLPEAPVEDGENERIASIRWEAMRLKSYYLEGAAVEKAMFRKGFVDTEAYFDTADVCSFDKESKVFLKSFDIRDWYNRKRDNWELLRDIKSKGVHVLRPEGIGCYPFSLILVFDSSDNRDRVRKALIERQVYPAVLWNVPPTGDAEVYIFSSCMLSVHCDARYKSEDILELKTIIESIL